MEKDKKGLSNNDKIIIEELHLKSGEKLIRQYEKGKFLGKGGFAKCIELVQSDNRKIYAAKVISKSTLQKSRSKQKLMSEIKIHKHLKNENIVNFEHFFEDSENVYILLELCQNQTLNELLRRRKRLTELEIKCYLMQMLNALRFIHANHIIHRDLKLSNLFLTNNMQIKVGDFGLATKLNFEGERKKTVCGTPNYIAPEILDSKSGHSYEADIWSLGVIVYTLLFGKPPFETSDVKTTYKKIKINDYSFPENIMISKEAKNLIENILVTNPLQRIPLDKIYEHEFLKNKLSIPKTLPSSTLACPPSVSYLKKLMPNKDYSIELPNENKILAENTAPLIALCENKNKGKSDFRLTERRASENINVLLGNKKNEFMMNHNNNNKFFNGTKENFAKIPIKEIIPEINCQIKPPISTAIVSELNILKAESASKLKKSDIYLEMFLDYSLKYGLGYLLNNGTYGVCFNDSTKIFTCLGNHQIYYIDKKDDQKKDDIILTFSDENCPKEILKKLTLLGYFKKYLQLEEKEKNLESKVPENDENLKIYVKKWRKTNDSILFRLSNKLYQVIFNDKSQIILSPEKRTLIYKNSNGEKQLFPISVSLKCGNEEIVKKVKYVKELLTSIYKNNLKLISSRQKENHLLESDEKKNVKNQFPIKLKEGNNLDEDYEHEEFFLDKEKIHRKNGIPSNFTKE